MAIAALRIAPPPQPSPARGEGVQAFLPYGRQVIEDDDIAAVAEALRGDYLTTGPLVEAFEKKLAETVGASHAVACSNGTAALYIAARALGLGPGSTIVVPAITFLATASAPHLFGAEVVFADVDPDTGLMRVGDLEAALSRAPNRRADAVFPVHFAGQSCDMPAIAKVARAHGMKIVEDAAHALGTAWSDHGEISPVGANAYADATTFSFHPVKSIAMGEGGAVTTEDSETARKLRLARNHGIVRSGDVFQHGDMAHDTAGATNPWYYELAEPGFNFRVPDINCALGISQLKKLRRFVKARRKLVAAYDEMLKPLSNLVRPMARDARSDTAWHIYVVRIDFAEAGIERGDLMRALAAEGIGTQVHYIPVHRQPYYVQRYGELSLPGAEAYYAEALTLPLHAGMSYDDVARVVDALKRHLVA
jgi:UDP-4-amino-4,6-dideoxy-N-acetyl-beta-L-altrosamine transaminase